MTDRVRSGVVAVAIGLLFVAGGGFFVYPYLQDVTGAEPVDAVVVSASVTDANAAGYGNPASAAYYPEVTYEYAYRGTEYTSESVFPGSGHATSRSEAKAIVAEHPAGEQVTAYVDPGDPDRAYLVDSGMPWWYYLAPGFGGLLALLGLHNVVQGIRGVEVPDGPG